MKILVTGGAGFIGYHLANRLVENGNDVTICDNLFRGKMDRDFRGLVEKPNVAFINVDLTKASELTNLDGDFDIIYHLAAINGTKYFYEIPHQVLKVNILSLLNILDFISASDCKKLVWTSSSEVYSGTEMAYGVDIPTPEDIPLAINDVGNPRFSYAGSKVVGELLCLNYSKAYGFDVGLVRPHNIYGPRMGFEHVIPEFLKRIFEREDPFKIYGGNQTRSFCYIDDAVSALEKLGSIKVKTDILNMGNNQEEIKIEDLALRMFDLADFHPQIEILEPLKGSVSRRCPDIKKAKKILDFEPRVDLNEGLKKTMAWYFKALSE